MAKVMFSERKDGIYFYLAKKDLEEKVVNVEVDSDGKWGGEIEIGDGSKWYFAPIEKKFPVEVVAKKA